MTALLDLADQLPLREGLSARTAKYVALSRSYAVRGEGRPALLALWAADVQVLQVLLLESGLESAPDPEAQMALVADAALMAEQGEPSCVAVALGRVGLVQHLRLDGCVVEEHVTHE